MAKGCKCIFLRKIFTLVPAGKLQLILMLVLLKRRIQEGQLDLLLGQGENYAGGAWPVTHLGQGLQGAAGSHRFLVPDHHYPAGREGRQVLREVLRIETSASRRPVLVSGEKGEPETLPQVLGE